MFVERAVRLVGQVGTGCDDGIPLARASGEEVRAEIVVEEAIDGHRIRIGLRDVAEPVGLLLQVRPRGQNRIPLADIGRKEVRPVSGVEEAIDGACGSRNRLARGRIGNVGLDDEVRGTVAKIGVG